MYLSRIELNGYRRDTMKALGSPEVMHAAVMQSFNSFNQSVEDRPLWRVDRIGPVTYLLVQSARKPDFTHIVEQFGRPNVDMGWDTLDYDNYLSKIEQGQTYRFRLRANPTYAVSEGEGRGKVYPHVTAEQQMNWLKQKSLTCGFSIESEEGHTSADIVQRDIKHFKRNGNPMTLSVVTFEGVLIVTDAESFRNAIMRGIGRSKAYGCGMLTVMRC